MEQVLWKKGCTKYFMTSPALEIVTGKLHRLHCKLTKTIHLRDVSSFQTKKWNPRDNFPARDMEIKLARIPPT